MRVHLVDGTYELFRHFYGSAKADGAKDSDTAATRGVVATIVSMLSQGATHIGVATDHVIESFRNDMWPPYKSSIGVPEVLLGQFPLVEEALEALGVRVWPMVDLEADDGLASAAAVAADDERVEQVVICTPDKDLNQSVRGRRVVLLDRRRDEITDEDGVRAKYGVGPESIADWLALVGDSADGFPGVPGWGKRTASAVLGHYVHLEEIPGEAREWDDAVSRSVRGAPRLATDLTANRDLALLFRVLATLRVERSLLEDVDELAWTGPGPGFEEMCDRLRDPTLAGRVARLRRR